MSAPIRFAYVNGVDADRDERLRANGFTPVQTEIHATLASALTDHPIVRAARKVVERHRGPGDLATLLDACDELADALNPADDARQPAAAKLVGGQR